MAWQALAWVPLEFRRRLLFAVHLRRWGNFRSPTTFNEKVNWRIIHDRRTLLTWTCDKVLVKTRAAEYGLLTPRTLWFGTEVEQLKRVEFPDRWILKPNNRTGLYHFGTGQPDIAKLLPMIKMWSRDHRVVAKGEWGYSKARSGFLVEEWLGDGPDPPADYKVFVFDGEARIVLVDVKRRLDHRAAYYSPSWDRLQISDCYPAAPNLPAPANLPELIRAAERMATGFDFLRVDLYLAAGEVYVGEVTPYPSGGLQPFRPRSADRDLGAYWQLPV